MKWLVILALLSEMRQAEVLHESRDFDGAKKVYESIQAQRLDPWQEVRLFYNLGTLELLRGNLKEALKGYAVVPFKPEAYPYTSLALKTNLAIIYYREAMNTLTKKNLTPEDYIKVFSLLSDSKNAIVEAKEAKCHLEKLEGRKECLSQQDLDLLESAVEKELALASEKYGALKIETAPLKEAIPFLLVKVDEALDNIAFLQKHPSEEYRNLFVQDMESWRVYWDQQIARSDELKEPYLEFLNGLDLFGLQEFEESRIAFLSVEANLSNLMKKLWGNDPIIDLIQRLLASYQRALNQFPLQLPMLSQLQLQQERILEFLEDQGMNTSDYKKSMEFLGKSINLGEVSRVYLEEARQYLRRLLWKLEKMTPYKILEEGLTEQKHALNLNFWKNTPQNLLNQSQVFTLNSVSPFIEEVLKKEQIDWETTCQCQPWEVVIPLFVKGEEAAIQAKEALGDQKLALARVFQEEAVKYWSEALHYMKHPLPKKEKEKKEDETLRKLQKMAQEDRKPKPAPKQLKKGTRPW